MFCFTAKDINEQSLQHNHPVCQSCLKDWARAIFPLATTMKCPARGCYRQIDLNDPATKK